MDAKAAFDQVMQKGVNMALATCVDGVPNVRVVTFAYDIKEPNKVYFATFPGNRKIQEFQNNEKVCFVSLPEGESAELQVRCQGTVKLSFRPLAQIAPFFVAKMPEYQEMLDQGADVLLVYEVVFKDAQVTIGISEAQIIQVT